MTADSIGFGLLLLGVFLLLGKYLRVKIPILQDLFLPSSLIAGLIVLVLGPEVMGEVFDLGRISPWFEQGFFPSSSFETWQALPGLMINVVFASLFLGTTLPKVSSIWKLAGPQVLLGYGISFGQYVIGLILVLVFLTPVFGIDPMAGALIEVGFVGGHGTAAGLGSTFSDLGFDEGLALATGLATVGVFGGAVIGITLMNWGVRKNKLRVATDIGNRSSISKKGISEFDERDPAGYLSTKPESIEPLALHFGFIALSIIIGYGILQAFVWLESVTWGLWTGVYLFEFVPLFPLAMIGGIIVQYVLTKRDQYDLLDAKMIARLQGLALDILIISAMATLQLSVIGENLIPFLVLALGGILWTVFCFVYLAPRIIPSYWFERGIGDFGQSMGVAATGLMLMRIADPENQTPALESFGYKQILFEPVVGGGLFTAASVPLVHQFGPFSILLFTGVLTLIFLAFGLRNFKKHKD